MFRRAWRRLRASPLFTIFAVTSLALGVGVTTAIYAVVASLTTTGLSLRNPDRIGLIVGSDPFDGRRLMWRSVLSRADLADLRATSATFRDIAVSAPFYQALVGSNVSEVVSGEAVSGSYFSMLEIVPDR